MSYRKKHIRPKIKNLKPKKVFYKRFGFWIFLSTIIIIILAYFLLFSSTFQVETLTLSGNEKIASQNIENVIWQNINKEIFTIGKMHITTKSIFLTNTEKLAKDITSAFPVIEDAQIQKRFPKSIIVTVRERQPFAIFCSQGEQCFWIDSRGIIFEVLSHLPQDVMILKDQAVNKNIFLGEDVVNQNIIEAIDNVQKNLKDHFQIGVKEVFVSNPLIFKTFENWQLYFDPTQDIDLQITKMNILLKDEISSDSRKNLQYIYLQYKYRAYYK